MIFDREMVVTYPQDKIFHTRVDINGYAWRYLVQRTFWEYNKFAFPTNMRYIEDMELMTKMVYYTNHIVFVPGALYIYKYRPNSILTSRGKRRAVNACYGRARMNTYLFLCDMYIRTSPQPVNKIQIRLLGVIPVLSARYKVGDTRITWRLFGIIPVITYRNRVRGHRWRI